MKKLYQPYHLVTLSPWPILMSMNLMFNLVSILNMFYFNNFYYLMFSMLFSLMILFQWWRDVIRESNYQGFHSKKVLMGLKLGMILFIISEIFFFISIFWCYLHMFLSPSIEIGMNWPPMNIITFNPYYIPLLNTIILLSSGITVTWCHYSIINNLKNQSFISLMYTIFLGIIFIMLQYMEYYEAMFTISDSIYGSIFFMSTGFHGFHVIIGVVFLIINLFRIKLNSFSLNHHFGFEAASWYWHFVDIVWMFLYLLVYYLIN